jgi:hypothetical protein
VWSLKASKRVAIGDDAVEALSDSAEDSADVLPAMALELPHDSYEDAIAVTAEHVDSGEVGGITTRFRIDDSQVSKDDMGR